MKGMKVQHYAILSIIIMMGIFLRTWDYGNLLHFELDQARDVYVVYDALVTGQWPVYGPMASGSDLFLGPLFYYGPIIAGGLFGVSPEAIASTETMMSILSLPLVFMLMQRTFSMRTAVGVTAIVATSTFFVTYGRFAWNPNTMVFWSLFLTYCMISLSDEQKKRYAIYKMIGVGVSAGILIQLHFIAFLCVPLIIVVYGMFKFSGGYIPNWRVLSFGVVAFLLPTAPMIYQEIVSSGATSKALFETIRNKGSHDDSHHLIEKAIRSVQKSSTYFATVMVPSEYAGTAIRTKGMQFICDSDCVAKLPYLALSLGLLMMSVVSMIRLRREIDINVLVLMSLWLIVGGAFLTMLAYQISPRFYLFMSPPIIFLWACLIEMNYRLFGRVASIVVLAVICINISINIVEYNVLTASQSKPISTKSDSILGRNDRVTLGGLRKAADIIAQDKVWDDFVIVGDNRYARALHYLIDVEKSDTRLVCYAKRGGLPGAAYAGRNIWLLVRERTARQIPEVLMQSHEAGESRKIGSINLYRLSPRETADGNTASNFTRDNLPQKCHVR